MHEIRFHRSRHAWGCFVPGSAHPIELEGRRWATAEHYVQAMKFDADHAARTQIAASSSITDVRRLVAAQASDMRADWAAVRDGVMYRALLAKFGQHRTARETLLGTGHSVLVEHAYGDRYWGDDGDGTGQNMLGRTLMAVREELRRAGAEVPVGSQS